VNIERGFCSVAHDIGLAEAVAAEHIVDRLERGIFVDLVPAEIIGSGKDLCDV